MEEGSAGVGVETTPVLPRAQEALGDAVLDSHAQAGDETILVQRERWFEVMRALRDRPELAFDVLIDLSAVDYLGREPRFEVVAHLYSLRHNQRLRVKAGVPESETAIASLVPVWKGANWLERECFDMFGIRFEGHPDLRRLLLYEEFVGHPLRKDYPVNKRQPLVPERDPISQGWKPS